MIMVRSETSAGAIVFRDNGHTTEFLLLGRKEGFMDFPKGHIEEGETPEQAAIREIQEETGITCQFLDGFREEMNYRFNGKEDIIKKKVILFLARVSHSDKVHISHEHESFLWAPYDKAMKVVKHTNQKRVLRAAMSFLLTRE